MPSNFKPEDGECLMLLTVIKHAKVDPIKWNVIAAGVNNGQTGDALQLRYETMKAASDKGELNPTPTEDHAIMKKQVPEKAAAVIKESKNEVAEDSEVKGSEGSAVLTVEGIKAKSVIEGGKPIATKAASKKTQTLLTEDLRSSDDEDITDDEDFTEPANAKGKISGDKKAEVDTKSKAKGSDRKSTALSTKDRLAKYANVKARIDQEWKELGIEQLTVPTKKPETATASTTTSSTITSFTTTSSATTKSKPTTARKQKRSSEVVESETEEGAERVNTKPAATTKEAATAKEPKSADTSTIISSATTSSTTKSKPTTVRDRKRPSKVVESETEGGAEMINTKPAATTKEAATAKKPKSADTSATIPSATKSKLTAAGKRKRPSEVVESETEEAAEMINTKPTATTKEAAATSKKRKFQVVNQQSKAEVVAEPEKVIEGMKGAIASESVRAKSAKKTAKVKDIDDAPNA